MRALIIEDNPTTASYVCQGLKENYFTPDIAHDGQEGLFLFQEHTYDVVVLDVMLPRVSGWDIIKAIRVRDSAIPVLFLTAKDTVEDRVKGLALGADDYLIKPFAFSELLARIHALLRRKQPNAGGVITIDNLMIDPQKHHVVRDGQAIPLTTKEYMLLSLFAHHQGLVLTRTFIAEQVWDIHFETDTNVIDVAIKRLRDKIDKHFATKLIHSVRGVGYVFGIR